ncbi:MAG: O-antigen ligase family protein [Bacteroidota bacterium]
MNKQLIKSFAKFLNSKIFILLAGFVIWTLIISLWSFYPTVTFQRSIVYLGILIVTAFITFIWYHHNRNYFGYFVLLNTIIVSLSMISLFFNYPGDLWSRNNVEGFHSVFTHKNTYASLILFTLPGILEKLFIPQNRYNYVALSLVTLLLVTEYSLLFLSNSRASFISSLIILLPILFLLSFKKYIMPILVLFFLLFIIVFSFSKEVRTAVSSYFNRGTNILASRSELFLSSLHAAKEGGITGIGFGISHPQILNNANGSHYDNGRYIREKGNSILALIEEVGIIGLALFFAPIVFVFIQLLKLCLKYFQTNNTSQQLVKQNFIRTFFHLSIISLFLNFIIHSNFEAWMVGISSVQMILFLSFLFSINIFLNVNLVYNNKNSVNLLLLS